jgi:hypothetical protein
MKLSRRHFIAATASASSLWMSRMVGLREAGFSLRGNPNCVVVDLQFQCALRESLEGYRAALAGAHNYATEFSDTQERCRLAIVPGVGSMDNTVASSLFALLESGTRVLLESGAGFWTASQFAAQQEMLHRCFGIEVEPPVDLWPGNSEELSSQYGGHDRKRTTEHAKFIPYVEYVWPRKATVRDFSRVIPVLANNAEVIGRVGRLPVAVRKWVGNGTLIFIGSPLGPALRAGDPEARSWLQLLAAL